MKRIIFSENAPAPVGPYSQATEINGFVFCSGQISIDPKTNEVYLGDVQTQARMVLENIKALLMSAGLSMDHVVKTQIFLTNMADFTKVNEVYAQYFKIDPPARSTIAVAGLPKGVAVEIEVMACRN